MSIKDDLYFAKAQRAMIIDRATMGEQDATCMQCRAAGLAIIATAVLLGGAAYLYWTRKKAPR